MKMKPLLTLTAIFLIADIARSQDRWQADVQVRSVSVTEARNRLTCNVEIFSEHDDDARRTTVHILLPVGVRVISLARGCTASPSESLIDRTQGGVTCNLGRLGVRESRTVRIATTVPPAGLGRTFGAFAWSITPDPRPRNNYGEGTAP